MCFKIKRLGNDTPLRAIAHPLASPPGSAAPRVRHALWDQNCTYRARDMGSEVAAARLLFLAFKKNVSLRACSARGQWLARLEAPGAAGLKKLLPVLTTARWRARDMGSVVAAARLLFFAHKKVSLSAILGHTFASTIWYFPK